MPIAERSGLEMTVTVVTRNRAPILRHCLRRLSDQTLDPSRYEIVVVDDGSTDDTTAVIADAQREAPCQIRAFRFPDHRGLSAVRNQSVCAARGAVIVFVDSDGLVPRSFLSVHLAAHREGRGDIIGRGPIVAVDSVEHPFGARWNLLDLNTSFFDTSNASVRREHLFAAGLFDLGLADWEGLEMGLRLRQLGLRRVHLADAPLYHYQPAATAASLDASLHIQEDRARSARQFLARHPSLEVRLITSQTPMHRWLNALLRGFGVVHAGNLPAWVERCERWGVPALSRVLAGAVVTDRYLAHLQRLAGTTAQHPTTDTLDAWPQRDHNYGVVTDARRASRATGGPGDPAMRVDRWGTSAR